MSRVGHEVLRNLIPSRSPCPRFLNLRHCLQRMRSAGADGTIDAKELSSPAGHALLRLLK